MLQLVGSYLSYLLYLNPVYRLIDDYKAHMLPCLGQLLAFLDSKAGYERSTGI